MVPEPGLAGVRSLYDRGLYVQACRHGESLGPIHRWSGVEGRILAARLAATFGAIRLGDALIALAWRADRSDPLAAYYRSMLIARRRGPLAAWRFLRERGELAAEPGLCADWLGQHADVLSELRDFRRAHACLERAHRICPDRAWIFVEEAVVLEREDRREAALSAAQHALALRPGYRPAVSHAADLLLQLGRDPEALELLHAASRSLESPGVTRQLVVALMERELWSEAREAIRRLEALMVLPSEEFSRHLHALHSDLAYGCGDLEQALRHAAHAGPGFYASICENLKGARPDTRRVQIPVRFVRQDFATCVPATLSALAAYWERPVDHASLAAEICYGGTRDHVERDWAERSGFAAAEFRVTWEAARALLDRKVPFTVTTGGATWAHSQAVIGYDELRATFTVLEPGSHVRCEVLAESWLSQYRSLGPRGLALVPEHERSLLEGLQLPDQALYDRSYRLKRALAAHRRDDALVESRAIAECDPEHPLAIEARWTLASYDADGETASRCVSALLSLHGAAPHLELAQVQLLRTLARRDELLDLLRAVTSRASSDPALHHELAIELMGDARCWDEATRILHRLLPSQRTDGKLCGSLGQLAHRQGRFEEALELYRFASCLAPTDETLAMATFSAARLLGREQEGLEFLRERVEQAGARSGQPVLTVHEALCSLGLSGEAFACLEEALALRPDDMDVALVAARRHAQHGRLARANELLVRAKDAARRSEWLRASAEVACLQSDPERALELALELGSFPGQCVEDHQVVLQALSRSRGSEDVLEYVLTMLARAPDHLGIQTLGIEWLRRDHAAHAEQALSMVLDRHSDFAWGRRELALLYAEQGRAKEAREQAEEALRLEPGAAASHSVLGVVLREQHDLAAARAAWYEALRLDIDLPGALHALVESCESTEQRLAALAWTAEQLELQVVFGAGLSAYRNAARAALDGDEVLSLLRRTLAARPELQIAWSETIAQLEELGRLDEALELATRAVARFPQDPTSWQERGRIEHALQRYEESCTSLQRAVELGPGRTRALFDLSSTYRAAGRLADARLLLERAVEVFPREPACRGALAELLVEQGDLARARETLERALLLDASYTWAWDLLAEVSRRLGAPGATLALARERAEQSPRDLQVRLALARQLADAGELEAALPVLDECQAIEARVVSLHDLRARLLCGLGRFEEALAACAPELFGARLPSLLRARAAWVEWRRGAVERAIEQMRGLLEADRSIPWAFSCLAEWCESRGQAREARDALVRRTRLEPKNAEAWEELGELLLRQDDRAGARAAFCRGVESAPDRLRTGLLLIDLMLEDHDLDAAERIVTIVQRHGGGAWAAAFELRLARLRADDARVLTCARRIIRESCDSDGPLDVMESDAQAAGALGQGWAAALIAEEVQAGRAHARALYRFARCSEGETQVAALLRARDLEPGWGELARALSDSLRRLDRHDEALDVLRGLVAREPGRGEHHAFLAELQAALGDRVAAVETMKRALALQPCMYWGWGLLRRWSAELRRSGFERAYARSLTQQEPRRADVWVAFIHVCDQPADDPERLQAVHRVLALEPLDLDHHDLHARLLADMGRYEEAHEACAPAVFAEVPLALCARSAWVEWQRGRRDDAQERIERLLEADPHSAFSWIHACQWALDQEQWQRAERLARRMVRHLPERAEGHELLAKAVHGSRPENGASHVFPEASREHRLQPGARHRDFALHLAGPELAVAEATVSERLSSERDEFTLARAVQIAAARGRGEQALELFGELCVSTTPSSWPIEAAWRALLRAGWRKPARVVLEHAVAEGRAGARAAEHWVTHIAVQERSRSIDARLVQLLQRETGSGAGHLFFTSVRFGARMRRVQCALGDRMTQESALWGAYGYALVQARRFAEAVRWLSDWRERRDLEPWMLANAVHALRTEGYWDAAAEAGNLALERWAGPDVEIFALWRALDDALAGRTQRAAEQLGALRQRPLDRDRSALVQLASACLAASDAYPFEMPAGSRPAVRALRMLRSVHPAVLRRSPPQAALSLAYLHVAAHVARVDGRPWTRLSCAVLSLGVRAYSAPSLARALARCAIARGRS